jgi:ParB-like chromosome segregation protein Spo0J
MKLPLGHRTVEIERLSESPDNPRHIAKDRFEALKHALREDPKMLEARPLIATPDGSVVCGNMRLRAAQALGWNEIKVYVADLDPQTRREWMIRDNNEYGEWVPDELAAMLSTHKQEDGDMAMLGFAEPQIDELLKLTNPDEPPPDAPVEPPPTDVWGVVVTLDNEESQANLLERLTEEGYECRALLA